MKKRRGGDKGRRANAQLCIFRERVTEEGGGRSEEREKESERERERKRTCESERVREEREYD